MCGPRLIVKPFIPSLFLEQACESLTGILKQRNWVTWQKEKDACPYFDPQAKWIRMKWRQGISILFQKPIHTILRICLRQICKFSSTLIRQCLKISALQEV